MPSTNLVETIYKSVREILKADATITAKVPAENIFPANNAGSPRPGGIIVIAASNVAWSDKAKRGGCTLKIDVESVESVVEADNLLQHVKDLITSKSMTRNGLRVAAKLQPDNGDTTVAPSQRLVASGTWNLKYVEG